ncbi:lysine exporter LysO family protein [Wielerella bovis]|uniref:lysine exporter LysO family protein n=1 Tax=Wielerella bovis TaxID=2917790 RepID=UPI002019613E|nr:lysine exporter LysO family protein [Wielerella bovis]MCG7657046.1 lysine exporter LysO family protein [Wielerella bovis]MCG7659269.1 lysine exporter LysO family protein [Wielerella bovis]
MDSLKTLVLVLTPMFIGFCIKLPESYLKTLDKILNLLVYTILLLIGIGLARIDNLFAQLNHIAGYSILLFILTITCNVFILGLFDKTHPFEHIKKSTTKSHKIGILGSLKQLATACLGIIIGQLLPTSMHPPESTGTYALMLLILIVGIQLRSNGIPLQQVLLNKRGLHTALWFILSCLLAGSIFALILPDVSLTQGLALSSGYGWYSLSGIIMTQAYGATWRSVALLNDLMREFFALAFIPLIMKRYQSTAVGVGGATSMDFTLPIIQQSGGLMIVPVAISFGFIVNLAAPFLMLIFSTL